MRLKEKTTTATTIVTCVVSGIAGYAATSFVISRAEEAKREQAIDRRLVEQVNGACGERPVSASRGRDETWTVRCADGTTAIVSRDAVAAGVQVMPR